MHFALFLILVIYVIYYVFANAVAAGPFIPFCKKTAGPSKESPVVTFVLI